MGMYDTVNVYMNCPYCKETRLFDAQTKDLLCMLHKYSALPYYWYDHDLGKKFREKMPVYPSVPNDRSAGWKSQADEREAMAEVPDEFKHLKFINVSATCKSPRCQFDADREWILIQGEPSGFGRHFEGKLSIKYGRLFGEIYDIEKDDLTEEKLEEYKKKYPDKYEKLMKIYKHEPFVCRYWGRHE